MQERDQSRLASGLTFLIGVWMILSPIWLQMTGGATTSTIITGAIIVVFSAIQYFWTNSLPSWINGAAAVWAFISVFIFTMSSAATLSMILSAVAVFLISLWAGSEVDVIERHHHNAVSS